MILGDSFTFGDGVSDTETYSYYLQEMLPTAEIINMGVHGYAHDQMLIYLMEEGIKYEPNIVILGFLSRDMPRNLLTFRDFAKPKFVLEHEGLKLVNSPVLSPEEVLKGDFLKWDWARPRSLDVCLNIKSRIEKAIGLYRKDTEDITAAILDKIISVSAEIPAVPIFVFLPDGREMLLPADLTPAEEFLFASCRDSGNVECFSTRPFFAGKISKGTTFKTTGHWGPMGHLAAAQAIKRYLVDKGHVVLPPARE
ncbi:MAG: hypothetical protein JRJ60_15020 [Deltaproteobacteria bacterium]|nr:hypothetical protein [Deltaproteobacteria bacterium]